MNKFIIGEVKDVYIANDYIKFSLTVSMIAYVFEKNNRMSLQIKMISLVDGKMLDIVKMQLNFLL